MEKQADVFLEDVPCEPKKDRRKLGQEAGTPDNLRQNRTWHVRRKTACPWLRLRKTLLALAAMGRPRLKLCLD